MWSKDQSELAKTQFRPRLVQRLKKIAVSVFFGPGPVIFDFRKRLDQSWSQSCFFGPKNWTGLDFQTLIFHHPHPSTPVVRVYFLLLLLLFLIFHHSFFLSDAILLIQFF